MNNILNVILFATKNIQYLNSFQKEIKYFTTLVNKDVNFTIAYEDGKFGLHDTSFNLKTVNTIIDNYLLKFSYLFIISDCTRLLKIIEKKDSCLCIHLTQEIRENSLNKNILNINSLTKLKGYFNNNLPLNLLSILSRKKIKLQNKNIANKDKILEKVKSQNGLYVFGTGTIGRQIFNLCDKLNIKVLGFYDNDENKQGTKTLKLKVHAPDSVSPNDQVIIIASGNHSYCIEKQMKELNCQYILNLSEFYYIFNCASTPEINYYKELWENRVKYHALYIKLYDDKSKYVLDRIIKFRKTFNTYHLYKISEPNYAQWFDPNILMKNVNHIYIDGGGYDGDTVKKFIEYNKKYKKIYYFEPDNYLYSKAKRSLKQYKNVYIYNIGLSDKKGVQSFLATGGTEGRFTQEEDHLVNIDSIDNVVNDKATLIKLDVEGLEADAIKGARSQIKMNSPFLAVAAYHKASDLWSIPFQIDTLNNNYRFKLRHYTQVAYETVLYAVPNNDIC